MAFGPAGGYAISQVVRVLQFLQLFANSFDEVKEGLDGNFGGRMVRHADVEEKAAIKGRAMKYDMISRFRFRTGRQSRSRS